MIEPLPRKDSLNSVSSEASHLQHKLVDQSKPHAALAISFLQQYKQMQQQSECQINQQQQQHQLPPALQGAYFNCLPSHDDLKSILPVLLHHHQQQQQHHNQQTCHHNVSQSQSQNDPCSPSIAAVLAPSPSASAALQHQLECLEEEWAALRALCVSDGEGEEALSALSISGEGRKEGRVLQLTASFAVSWEEFLWARGLVSERSGVCLIQTCLI